MPQTSTIHTTRAIVSNLKDLTRQIEGGLTGACTMEIERGLRAVRLSCGDPVQHVSDGTVKVTLVLNTFAPPPLWGFVTSAGGVGRDPIGEVVVYDSREKVEEATAARPDAIVIPLNEQAKQQDARRLEVSPTTDDEEY